MVAFVNEVQRPCLRRTALALALGLVLVSVPSPTRATVACGAERWDVKTLDAPDIDFQAHHTSVLHLRTIDRPDVGSDDPRIARSSFGPTR
jgi:D-serine deaminase-like pyridoxal phosphate-dependent protein